MTAMTFESIVFPARRARHHRPALHPVAPVQTVPVAIPVAQAAKGSGYRAAWIALIALTIALHAAIITAVNRRVPVAPAVPKAPPLTIDMAPPKKEVPPPVVQPKPLPKPKKVAPAKKAAVPQPVPSAPVVKESPVEPAAPSQETVRVATESTPAPAPVAATPAQEERVTEPRGYAGYLSNPAPSYPSAAQKRGLEGRVVLKVHVLANGQPDNITVARSSGHPILDEAAIKAVTAWVFEPAKRGQTPINGWVNVPLNFKLS